LIVCQTASFYKLYDSNEYREINNQLKSLNPEQLDDLDEYFSRKINEELLSKNFDRNTRDSNENYMTKRDALWTTTEVLECVRRLRYYKDISKLDLVTEMLNCYRRLKQNG